ncbi:multidrug efflux RND transporter permease subunit [Pseudolabrys taiwanensis]|uniref:Multidrug efflux RND transporter permease subunit n=1 Tax=Pseudolabrys taiwanensis TaxID=331696 RepID=A0A345ZXK1_9HYPH|nr:multidrug efflux RND transporter permease subunit [Pseudolabrys taiwanensis]AXK81648.1 multidrug efflux RND transporter permease subunit [Pseudolabrys taiwanensis]
MQGGISAPFIRQPIATSLLMVGLLFVGLVAYPQLPVAPLPQIDFPTIQVSASLPGASPDTMASAVAQPLETQFAQIPGVAQMTSTSVVGSSAITIQFDLNRNIDAAANDVQSAINAAGGQLPKNLPSPPTYRKVNPADSPILLLGATSDTLPLTEVDDNVETKLAQQISQISGVAQVLIGGQQKPAIRIQLDPAKLVAKGLSLEDVRTPLSVTTVDGPKGTVRGDTRSYTIYTNDQLTQAKNWNDVIVAYRNGAPLRVRDIGQAVTGPQDTTQAGWADGKRGVILVIFKQPGANVIDTVDKINAALPKLRAAMPPSINVFTLSDRTQTIRAAVDDVQFTLLLTIALVVMVIFVFLRSVWATIIPSITVPLALLGACALMWIFGYSLDNLSLMALTIAVGFVVDDAIVMLENISRYVEEGESPFQAALRGSKEIAFTIVSISISLIAVLIPLLMMGGIIGRLFREFAVTLAMTIVVSAAVSLTLTPMMASRFLKPPKEAHHGRFYAISERAFDALLHAYERGLDVCLRHRFVTLCVFFATLGLSAYLFIVIPKGFFPQQDIGLLTGIAEASQDVSPRQMMQHLQELGDVVRSDPAVDHVAMFMGGSGNPPNTGRIFTTLKPRNERDVTADQVIARLRTRLDKVQGARLFLQAAQDVRVGGRASRTQFQYTLQGSDIAQLNEWAPKILDKLKGLPELRDVASDQQTNGTTLTLQIDRDQASHYGFTPQVIDDTLYDAFGQRQISQYFTQLSSYYVIMEVTPALQGDPSSLDRIFLRSPTTGGEVPLSAIAKWTTRPIQPLSISHQGQFPAITISFNLAQGAALGQATEAIGRAMAELNPPATINTTFQGNAQAFQDSLSTVPMLIIAALIVVYLILGVLYESYIHPITILSTLPSAGVGALMMLMLFHFDFSLIALIGIILLIGIVKKNGIMLVDFAIVAERDDKLSPVEAIRRAALLRFRPIMMTTMAALLGGVPLMLGHGTGSEIRQPLGYAMVGGLIVSQALTLFTTPVIYIYLDQFSHWLTRRRPREHGAAEEQLGTQPAE